MEQHPVPQNITSFEFRLIGDMTPKQFGFLAGGAILAYIIWQLPIPGFIKTPIAFLIAFLGFAFAFLPYEDRPLHRWLAAFLKSIYSPTQYVFRKTEEIPIYLRPDFLAATQKIMPVFRVGESRQKLEEYLKTLPKNVPTALDAQEVGRLSKIQALMGTIAAMPLATSFPKPHLASVTPGLNLRPRPEPTPIPPTKKLTFAEEGRLIFEENKKTVPTIPLPPEKIADRSEFLVREIQNLKKSITDLRTKQPTAQTAPAELINYRQQLAVLERQLEEAENERDTLMRMAIRLQKEMIQKPKGVIPTEVLEKTQAVKIISAQAAKEIGLPRMTNVPNIITGVVQDKRGVFLPNILVEVKDKEGSSIRAFKTNKLGQYAAATPLGNGVYTIELEDPRQQYIFDIIEFKADGSVLPPLAIYARSPTELEREKIHRSLFGVN